MPIRSERRFISLNNINPGMMIEFNYSKKDGGSGTYIVLVVDPKKENPHTKEPQLHGFIINDLNDEELINFFSSFGKSVKLDYEDRRASVVEGLNSDEAYEKFRSSKYVKDRSYRTFNTKTMSSVRQVLIGSID